MPTFLTRLRKRPKNLLPTTHPRSQPPDDHALKPSVIPSTLADPLSHTSPIDRRIHPDLNSLIADEPIYHGPPDVTPGILPAAPHDLQDSLSDAFVPLPLSTQKRSATMRSTGDRSESIDALSASSRPPSPSITAPIDPVIELSSHENPLPNQHILSLMPKTPQQPSSDSDPSPTGDILLKGRWSTFGRAWGAGSPYNPRRVGETHPPTPTTPSSSDLQLADPETRSHTPISTGSHSSSSQSRGRSYSHSHSNTTPHTFGIPTPPSSGFTFASRRVRHETPPPLPPLSHPAFFSPSSLGNTSQGNDVSSPSRGKIDQQPKRPRHASSLPTMSHRASIDSKSPIFKRRRREKTQSTTKTNKIFPVLHSPDWHSTPNRHSRSRSKSNNSVRRRSAEFSATQATSVGENSGFAGSWEAQVSSEMVRISLGKLRPGCKEVAGIAEFGQARGNNSIRPPALGSPFLLQDANTHNTSGTDPSDNTRPESDLVSAATRKGKPNLPIMTKGNDTVTSVDGEGPSMSPGGKTITSERTRAPSPPVEKHNEIPHPDPDTASTSLLMPPFLSLTAATPEASPISPSDTQDQQPRVGAPSSVLRLPSPPPIAKSTSGSSQKGKRKAEEAEVEGGGTPPKEHQREQRATFAVDPRPHRASANSNSSRAPSSYHRKRVRLSTMPESRPGSRTSGDVQNAGNTGSWSSRGSSHPAPQQSHTLPPAIHQQPHRTSSRPSLSQASIPMSALISPHAPSLSRSSTFHMRDPRKPAPVQTTPWSLSLPSVGGGNGWVERGGSPLHAWLFFIGFVIFPTWWVAAFVGIPRTRRLDAGGEKGVVLDDPQVEYDAKSWRFRCRVMAVISLFTYIPFIVLVAIFAPR